MLTRFVRIQLIIFAVATVVGLVTMFAVYLQGPVLLGIGRLTVTVQLPSGGGLYRLANVTYRGAQMGKVTDVRLTRDRAEAILSLDRTPRIPADLVAHVRSISAVGEQYVDLQPRTDQPPYLEDGAVIPQENVTVPQPVGPMLDHVSALLRSVPRDKLATVFDESSKALDNAGYDLGSLLDSWGTVSGDLRAVAPRLTGLIDDATPLLDAQLESDQAIRTWAHSLAGVTDSLATNDAHIRTILTQGPGALGSVTDLLERVKPTLPILLANLTSVSKVAVTYLPALEQLMVLIPPYFADLEAISPGHNASGLPLANFRIQISDPPACTVGFLPPSQWRSPADTETVDTPDGLYCKLPQDSPILVRGARNLPCMGKPGKRAPTVEICDSDKPYVPLAMRQHALGPNPIDPNLLAQGVPPDDRVTSDENIHAPVEGTPPPAPAGGAAPASHQRSPGTGPAVSVATYDPRTGRYAAPDGSTHIQSDLTDPGAAPVWQDLVLNPGMRGS